MGAGPGTHTGKSTTTTNHVTVWVQGIPFEGIPRRDADGAIHVWFPGLTEEQHSAVIMALGEEE